VNVRLLVLRLHLPAFVRRSILTELVAVTARAFGHPAPRTQGLSLSELLACSIQFSRSCAQEAMGSSADLGPVERRLFSEAYGLGRRARERLRLKTEAEGLAAARVLYGAIGIDFRPGRARDIVVPSCAFAPAYGPQVCRLMSSMDSGLVAGLTGADGIRFTERITEGAVACRALVLHEGGAP
jgi:hypothetical protein